MFLFWLSSMERASGWVGWLIELHLQVLRMELGEPDFSDSNTFEGGVIYRTKEIWGVISSLWEILFLLRKENLEGFLRSLNFEAGLELAYAT